MTDSICFFFSWSSFSVWLFINRPLQPNFVCRLSLWPMHRSLLVNSSSYVFTASSLSRFCVECFLDHSSTSTYLSTCSIDSCVHYACTFLSGDRDYLISHLSQSSSLMLGLPGAFRYYLTNYQFIDLVSQFPYTIENTHKNAQYLDLYYSESSHNITQHNMSPIRSRVALYI